MLHAKLRTPGRLCAPGRARGPRTVVVRASAESRRATMLSMMSAAALAAASGPANAAGSPAPLTEKAVLEGLRLSLVNGDSVDDLSKVVADNIVVTDPFPGGPVGGMYRGRKGLEDWYKKTSKVLDTKRIKVEKTFSDKNEFIVVADVTAVAKKTAKTFSYPVVYSIKVNTAGKMTSMKLIYDTATIAAATTK